MKRHSHSVPPWMLRSRFFPQVRRVLLAVRPGLQDWQVPPRQTHAGRHEGGVQVKEGAGS